MALTEQQIQKAVFDHFAWRGAPDAFVCHYPAGGFRRPVDAAILKSLGVVARRARRDRNPQRPRLRDGDQGRGRPRHRDPARDHRRDGARWRLHLHRRGLGPRDRLPRRLGAAAGARIKTATAPLRAITSKGPNK